MINRQNHSIVEEFIEREGREPTSREYCRAWRDKQKAENPHYSRDRERARKARDPKRHMLETCKANAKRRGIAFSISYGDVVWHDVCPYEGLRLTWDHDKTADSHACFDRINPGLGYVPGNVETISRKANILKRHHTVETLERYARILRERS